jgi:hypothetical protein
MKETVDFVNWALPKLQASIELLHLIALADKAADGLPDSSLRP